MFRVVFHEFRGKSKERFFNIKDPVKVIYKSIEDEGKEISKMKTVANKLGATLKERISVKLKKIRKEIAIS